MNRREFVRRALTAMGASFVGITGWAYKVEPSVIRTEEVSIPVPGLPADLEGFKIGFLTDLHAGPFITDEQIKKACTMLMAHKPDLVLLGGDLASDASSIYGLRLALAPLPRPYAVLGNWDYYKQPHLKNALTPKVRFLINEGVAIRPNLWLAGVDDVLYGEPDLKKALAGAPPGAVRILLAHEPDFVTRVLPEHRIALQLSGHSHGGQVRLPFVGPLLLPPGGRRFHSGLYRTESTQIYTSRGLGMAHLPIRFGCPPEITVLTLSRT